MCNKINITPKLAIEGEDRTLGAVLLGAPYSRKRESVLLPMIQQDIQSKPLMGVAVFDTDGIPTQAAARCARESGRPYVLLDPRMEWCPFFNPLIGDENEVFEDLRTVVSEYLPDLSPSLRALNESLLSNAIKVLKRLDKAEGVNGRYATFINMNKVLQSPSQDGRKLVIRFGQLKGETDAEQKENSDIASWFINEYYAERSKPFEQTACLRLLLGKLISEPHLRTVLNPDFDKGQVSEVDFDRLVSDDCVICVSAAKPTLGSLSRFFGLLALLKYRRPMLRMGEPRRARVLYVDEFQEFAAPELVDLFTYAYRSKLAATISLQSWSQVDRGGILYKQTKETLASNLRNALIFAGASKEDAWRYAERLGDADYQEPKDIANTILGLSLKCFGYSLMCQGSPQRFGTTKAGEDVLPGPTVFHNPLAEEPRVYDDLAGEPLVDNDDLL